MPYVYQADFLCDNCRAEIDVPKPSYPPPFDTDDYPSYVADAELFVAQQVTTPAPPPPSQSLASHS